jgi:hypothetical protein
MNAYDQKQKESHGRAAANVRAVADAGVLAPGPTQRRAVVTQQRLQQSFDRSPRVQTQFALSRTFDHSPRAVAQARLADSLASRPPAFAAGVAQRRVSDEEETDAAQHKCSSVTGCGEAEEKTPPLAGSELVQAKSERSAGAGAVGGARRAGLPEPLRAGVEALSGVAMDDVRVEYNSPEPAKVNALATTQGKNIRLGPGQQRHLPHEAWHAAQQKQGRVQPTTQMRGIAVNNDSALEREADVMGARAARMQTTVQARADGSGWSRTDGAGDGPAGPADGLRAPRQLRAGHPEAAVIQRAVGFEFETEHWTLSRRSMLAPSLSLIKNWKLATGNGWYMQPDGDSVEFATKPFAEGDFDGLKATMLDLFNYTGQLVANVGAGATAVSDYPGYTYLGSLLDVVPGDAAMNAAPQFTAGLSLESLRTMMSELGTVGTDAEAQLNNQPAYGNFMALAAAGAQVPGVSEAYRGIVALMGTYTAASAQLRFATFYKDIAPLMSRTNIGKAFQLTPEYQHAAGNPVALLILKTDLQNHVIASATHVFQGGLPRTAINGGMLMLPGIFTGGMLDMPRTGPTLTQWVDSVVDGDDALKGSYLNIVKWMLANNTAGASAITSTSMGTMDKTEDTGPGQVESPILEYRNLPMNVPRVQWQPLAHRLLRWVTRLNSPAIRNKSY